MSVSHSVYAAYRVVIAPPRDWGALDSLLEAQTPHADGREPSVARVHLFTVGDSEHVILATGYAELWPNTYRAVPSLAISAQWDTALREHVKDLGLTVQSGPCWHLVHDLS
ncbi:hypothetical protein BIV25_25935 [Streptomyces sp. MUSC 14]|uniref:hypothetical protein n=1 Tax=Streptomyces sp. MUSC 14 TaxID=1354889 RepID=UPI0008F5D7BF|nr:hypothetical protein [Streptomyces sp. MUSC 14]OIJ93225.1 hypothetical protein BIV25_25935 [Streptomyces sp. MUSC 14]